MFLGINEMRSASSLVAVGVALALSAGQAVAATQQEEDSVYQYGRWAVLSPAAGAGEPYVAAMTPDAANNLRPEEGFGPELTAVEVPVVPVVVESCTAGASCSFATYSRTDFAEDGTSIDTGPAFADFTKTDVAISDPSLPGVPGGPGIPATQFTVENDSMPTVESLPMPGSFGDGDLAGAKGTSKFIPPAPGQPGLGQTETIDRTSMLSHNQQDSGETFDFEGVEAGYWKDAAEKLVEFIVRDPSLPDQLSPIHAANGYFVTGQTATVEQMETFAAGNVNATYQGAVLDYGSSVRLDFDFGSKTFTGNFASGGGFQGFSIDGNVSGANFSASQGVQAVNGSFFNSGRNASGGVDNGAQIGVFSTDFVDGL